MLDTNACKPTCIHRHTHVHSTLPRCEVMKTGWNLLLSFSVMTVHITMEQSLKPLQEQLGLRYTFTQVPLCLCELILGLKAYSSLCCPRRSAFFTQNLNMWFCDFEWMAITWLYHWSRKAENVISAYLRVCFFFPLVMDSNKENVYSALQSYSFGERKMWWR